MITLQLQPPRDDTTAHVGYVSLKVRHKHRVNGATRRRLTGGARHLGFRAAISSELAELWADKVAHEDPVSAPRGILFAMAIGVGMWAAFIAVLS